jgi:hypothetical protein
MAQMSERVQIFLRSDPSILEPVLPAFKFKPDLQEDMPKVFAKTYEKIIMQLSGAYFTGAVDAVKEIEGVYAANPEKFNHEDPKVKQAFDDLRKIDPGIADDLLKLLRQSE